MLFLSQKKKEAYPCFRFNITESTTYLKKDTCMCHVIQLLFVIHKLSYVGLATKSNLVSCMHDAFSCKFRRLAYLLVIFLHNLPFIG